MSMTFVHGNNLNGTHKFIDLGLRAIDSNFWYPNIKWIKYYSYCSGNIYLNFNLFLNKLD